MITAKASHHGDASSYFSKFQRELHKQRQHIFWKNCVFEKTIIIRKVKSLLAKINEKKKKKKTVCVRLREIVALA